MKKQKLVASVLVASMMASLCGCSADNKEVIAVADEYAKAVVALDTDDIADVMEDSDDAEVFLDMLDENYHGNEKLEKVFDAISGTMTYEIDEKSVQASKKDGKASVSVTFKFADYEEIYEDVFDEGGNFEDYIEAIEDDEGENVTEITVDLDLVYKKDEWLIKDKKAKNLKKVYEFVEEIPDYSWCNFKAVGEDDFKAALYSVLGVDDDEIYEAEDTYFDSTISYSPLDQIYSLTIYDDPDDAAWEFEEMYDDFYWEFDDDKYEGTYTYYYDEEGGCGYLLLDGQCDYGGVYLYGGLYLKDDALVMVMSYDMNPQSANSDSVKDVNAFLNAIGYPQP